MQRKRLLRRMMMIAVFGIALGYGSVLCQSGFFVPSAMAQDEEMDSEVVEGQGKTLIDYIKIGGAIMVPIFLCSALSVGILFEMIMRLRAKVICPPDLLEEVGSSLAVKDYQKAWKTVSEDGSLFARIFSTAMERLPKGRDAMEVAAGEMTASENTNFRNKLNYLSLSAAIAPMLGLMGTISGMIKAFDAMATEGAIGDPAKLAGDIGEALVTTFSGLVVAIPSMVIFFVMQNRLKNSFTNVQTKIGRFIEDIDFSALPPDLVIAGKSVDVSAVSQTSSVKAAHVQTTTVTSDEEPAAAEADDEETVECPSCGKNIVVGVEKCPHCGTEMAWE